MPGVTAHTKKLLTLAVSVILLGIFISPINGFPVNKARAESDAEAKDRWVLKETTEKKFLCESGSSCHSPAMTIDQSGALITWGASLGTCEGSFQAIGKWTVPPETLIPGQSASTFLESSLGQTTACATALDADNTVSLMIGKMIPPDTADVGKWNHIGSATVHELLQNGKEFKDSKAVEWTIPQGNTDEELHLRLSAGTDSLPAGHIVFIYEYQTDAISTKDTPSDSKTETANDICAINPVRRSWWLPNFISSVYARDSGARFADFSGEVTVAPGSDPTDAMPAELDMVLDTGSIIKTESESTAIISFADMTTFCMKPFTTVVLDTPPDKESKLSLLAGKVWMNVKKMVENGTMDITMNQAVAGIKGTVLILEDDGDTSTVKVVSGAVEYASRINGVKTTVVDGQTVTADSSGLSAKTEFSIDSERANWQEFVTSGNGSEKDTSGIHFGIVVVLLGLVIGGGWFVKKRMGAKLKLTQ